MRFTKTIILTILLAIVPSTAMAVKVCDITKLQGSRSNKLTGFGLVMGLKGTGDGGQFAPSMKALAQLYKNYGISTTNLAEMKNIKNVAIVMVEVTLPEHGVREGDSVDVRVVSAGSAKSLAGGELYSTPLVSGNPSDPVVMATASGPLQLPDPMMPTVARIAKGATLEEDFIHNYVVLGRDLKVYGTRSASRQLEWVRPDDRYVTFVIDDAHAEWIVANTIAQCINEEALVSDMESDGVKGQLAVAFDPRTVIVRLPQAEWDNPAGFLSRIEKMYLEMPLTEARVIVDRTRGTISFTGDVEISPIAITHKGLTIDVTTTSGTPEAAAQAPRTTAGNFVGLDMKRKGGAKLMDLLDALNQLKVSPEDRIAVIENLYKGGQLHAKWVEEH